MGKTYLETIKYMIIAEFEVEGLVEKPDVIGAIFGQSEGLLGSQLDIKDLQQNGKIGRIEITISQNNNKTRGELKLPCSLSMVETSIIAASIETIDKVGPCDTNFRITKIEDTRRLKRNQIKQRAIKLLGKIMQDEIPDTRELMEDITNTFKTKEVILYGPDKLPAGPTLEVSKDIIIVEGRADVLNMLTYGFTNVISTGGARIPKSLPSIVKNKEVTLFLDGDRGADIQQSQLQKAINVDYIARAPDGKEVEELTQKEINQALRRKIKATYLSNSVYSPKPAPGLIKKSKFSTTYEHKVKNQQKPFLKNSIFYPEKQDNSFSNMLSNIPNIERIDSPKQDNYRNNNYKKNNDYKNKVNYKNNDVTNEYFKHKENNINPGYSNDFNKKNTLKEKVENAVKEFGTKLSDKNDNQLSSKNTQKQTNNIQSNNKKDITQQTNILKQESQIKNNNNLQKTKDEIKKPIPPKPKEKPKLTDKMIKNFSKILEDVEGKGKSRFLNEKLRRIGSANDKELLNKLKTFKTNKIFALVTDIEADQEIIKEAKEKQVKFLVSPKSKIKDDSEISILTYNELKK